MLAGLSSDHYSRIEQGRQPTISEDVVEALSRALNLDDIECEHLRDLAAPVRRATRDDSAPQQASPGLLRVMDSIDFPTLLLGRRGVVLARNALLAAVLGAPMEPGFSFLRWLFLDPLARERIVNWADFASAAVGTMRYEIGRHPGDRRLVALVAELRAADPDVVRWWDAHGVTDRTSVRKQIAHPVAGPLEFGIESVVKPHDLEQRLVVYTVEPDSPTARNLPLLAAWEADRQLRCSRQQ